MPIPPPPLDESIFPGQFGHIDDHQFLHERLNGLPEIFPSSREFGGVFEVGSDVTAAVQAAIDSVPTGAGARIRIPGPGLLTSRLEINGHRDVWLVGEGVGKSVLVPSNALAGLAVVRFTNYDRSGMTNLRIDGNPAFPPLAGVEFREDHGNDPSGVTATRGRLMGVWIGSDGAGGHDHGVIFTTAGLDQNNDFGLFLDCYVFNFSIAGYRTTHKNSLIHRVVGGSITSGVPGAVAFKCGEPDGGSAYDGGGQFDVSDTTFVSVPSYVGDYGDGVYQLGHPQTFSQLKAGEPPTRVEIQQVAITGTPTGGTFTLTFEGQTTTGINHNANAAAVESALEALSNLAPADVACTGGPLPGTPVVVTFGGAVGFSPRVLMTANGASLTGGSSPAVVVTKTQAGYGGKWFRSSPGALGLRLKAMLSAFGSAEAGSTLVDWQAPDAPFEILESAMIDTGAAPNGVLDFGDDDATEVRIMMTRLGVSEIRWNGVYWDLANTDQSGGVALTPGADARRIRLGQNHGPSDTEKFFSVEFGLGPDVARLEWDPDDGYMKITDGLVGDEATTVLRDAGAATPPAQPVDYVFRSPIMVGADSAAAALDRAYTPFYVEEEDRKVNRVLFEVVVQSGNIDVGIYAADGGSDAPGTKIVSSGSTACPVAGPASIAVTEQTLDPGKYYVALAADNIVATFRYVGGLKKISGLAAPTYTGAGFPLANESGSVPDAVNGNAYAVYAAHT